VRTEVEEGEKEGGKSKVAADFGSRRCCAVLVVACCRTILDVVGEVRAVLPPPCCS
jgi:hypothetical protein